MLQALPKAQQKGRAELTSLGTAVTTNTIHQDAITTHPSHNNCYRCRYSHNNRECPAIGQRCHNCNGMNHFTALCRSRRQYNRHSRHSQREPTNQDIAADLPADQAAETGHTTDVQEDREGALHHTPLTLSPVHKTS